MPGYQPISGAATGLLTEPATLLEFHKRGWIKTAEKNGSVFIAADQRYRAKYILHLRRTKGLSDEQIEIVLSVQRPPYSLADVDSILRQHGAVRGGETGRPGVKLKRADGASVS